MPQILTSSSAGAHDSVNDNLAVLLQLGQSSSPFPRWAGYSPASSSCCLSSQRCEKTWHDIVWCDHLVNSSSVIDFAAPGQATRRSRSTPAATASVSQMVTAILTTLGLTKTQLATILGLTRQAIYGWLKGTEPSTGHFERLSRLARMTDEVCQETRRPLYHRFVHAALSDGLPSIVTLLQQPTWDEGAIREALQKARRLTSERDQRMALERREMQSRRPLSEEEQARNLEDNLFALD